MSASRPKVANVTITGNSILNTGTIYQSYGVRLRHDACGVVYPPPPAVGEEMSAVSIQSIPVGDNRMGASCRAASLREDNVVNAAPLCPGIRIANCAPALGSGSDQMSASRPRVENVTTAGNSILNSGTIYQSYGVRLRHDACFSPTTDNMSNVNVQAVPVGNNRLGGSCKAPAVNGSSLENCPTVSPQIGSTLPGGIVCGSSGCRIP